MSSQLCIAVTRTSRSVCQAYKSAGLLQGAAKTATVHEIASTLHRAEKRRPKKKLYDPDDDGEKWQHDRFDLLDMPPEFDQYRVRQHSHNIISCPLSDFMPWL